jgi:hypothetical protein
LVGRDAAPAALEDPEAEHALELAQRLRQRRLADAVQRGGAMDAADPPECDEIVQLAKLEMPTSRSPAISITYGYHLSVRYRLCRKASSHTVCRHRLKAHR